MAIILFNPTNEVLRDQYIGEDVIIPSGGKVRVDDARGRHMLNVLGPRGLVTLEYGDEGEGEARKAAQGRERNLAFKRKQIMDFNVINDQRFQQKKPYNVPEPHLKRYAEELGIKIYEPYSTTDAAMASTANLHQELDAKNRELADKDTALSTLQAQVASLTEMMGKLLNTKPAAAEHWADFKLKFRNINGKHFSNWVADQWLEISAAPADVLQELADKYERLYSMPFPKNEIEARTVAQKVAA